MMFRDRNEIEFLPIGRGLNDDGCVVAEIVGGRLGITVR